MGVEKYNAGTPLVLDQLHGTWLLQYTTASEIVSLIQAADQFPLLQVGQLYQCFDCQGRTDGGTVENIVRWSVSGLLQVCDLLVVFFLSFYVSSVFLLYFC